MTRGLRVPMRDGVELVADHYAPTESPGTARCWCAARTAGLVLRPDSHARVYARRAATTCCCRAAAARSGPAARSSRCSTRIDDGDDTVAGCGSSRGSTAGSPPTARRTSGSRSGRCSMDPPPELRDGRGACVGPHDFHGGGVRRRARSPQRLPRLERDGRPPGGARLSRRIARGVTAAAPAAGASTTSRSSTPASALLDGRAPWYRDWASRPERDDPFWATMRARRGAGPGPGAGAARRRLAGPVPRADARRSTERLAGRGVDVALTVGPWTHTRPSAPGRPASSPGDARLARRAPRRATRAGPRRRRCGVVRHRATGGWRGPAGVAAARRRAGAAPPARRRAAAHEPAPSAAPRRRSPTTPADPTPAVGGRMLDAERTGCRTTGRSRPGPTSRRSPGRRSTRTSRCVGAPGRRAGAQQRQPARRRVRADLRGRRRGPVAQRQRRVRAARPPGSGRAGRTAGPRRDGAPVRGGHRIRLLVGGRRAPRFERNLGTGEPAASGTALRPSHRTIGVDGRSRVLLPVAPR